MLGFSVIASWLQFSHMVLEKRWVQFGLLLFLAFIWGSSFILMKIGLKSFTSAQAASIRIASAGLVLLPFAIREIKQLKRADVKYLLIAGFIGSFIPAFLFTKAQTRIDSALAGMLNSMTPVFTLIIGVLFLKVSTSWKQIAGLILGLTGALGLIASGEELSVDNLNSYAFLIFLATSCYAININVVKAYLTHLKGLQITSFSFLFIWPAAMLQLLTTDFSGVIPDSGWEIHLAALVGLGIIGTAFAMFIMNSLIRYTSAVFASSVTYIIPLFAITWGILDGERITFLHLIFMAVVLVGVYLINRKGK